MKLAMVQTAKGKATVAVDPDGRHRGLLVTETGSPGTLDDVIRGGTSLDRLGEKLLAAAIIPEAELEFLPPLSAPQKIICVGLNYLSHATETKFEAPTYPTFFLRVPGSLLAHGAPIVRPLCSGCLDFEGEFVAVIGRGGRHLSRDAALDHVVGYSVFNDASIRDYQMKTTQWTIGKNFDSTGAFGPYLISADQLPPGASGLQIETRLNGVSMQKASTSDLIFDVKTLVATLSEAMTLEAGDMIVTGTPGGVGFARDPKVYMRAGDVCEVEVEGMGLLRNAIVNEA